MEVTLATTDSATLSAVKIEATSVRNQQIEIYILGKFRSWLRYFFTSMQFKPDNRQKSQNARSTPILPSIACE
jgi:hypothetical protein